MQSKLIYFVLQASKQNLTMTNPEYCFFCCEFIPEENKIVERNDNSAEFVNSFDYNNYTSTPPPDYKAVKKNILQISHYLNVSRSLIDHAKIDDFVIKTCQSCTKISNKLSDYCLHLEVIKMKISYYLNLLTDRIHGVSGPNDGIEGNHQDLSNFQKTLHQNCLLKVQNSEENSYPKICLNKCPSPLHIPFQEIKLENTKDSFEMMEESEAEVEYQIKLEADPTITTLSTNDVFSDDLHSCPFCPFIVNGEYEDLHSHISNEHPEHFQADQYETSSVSIQMTDVPKNNQKSLVKAQDYNGPFKCNKCGKHFAIEGNLRRHLRTSKICAKDYDDQSSFWGNFECSNCNRRYTRKDYLKYHLKTVCKSGLIIDHKSGKREISLSNCTPREKRKHKLTKCEHCGMLVYQRNLKRHVNLKHRDGNGMNGKRKEKTCEICNVPLGTQGNVRNHMLVDHGITIEEKVKMFKCDVCNKSFEMKRSLKRHLENREKCRLGICDEPKIDNQVIDVIRHEEEPVLILSIPESNNDASIVTNGVHENNEEDPLEI